MHIRMTWDFLGTYEIKTHNHRCRHRPLAGGGRIWNYSHQTPSLPSGGRSTKRYITDHDSKSAGPAARGPIAADYGTAPRTDAKYLRRGAVRQGSAATCRSG